MLHGQVDETHSRQPQEDSSGLSTPSNSAAIQRLPQIRVSLAHGGVVSHCEQQ